MTVNNKKTVVVGLSGGVDSAVSALLLKQQGYNVIGVFMQNWDTVVNNDIKGHLSNTNDIGCDAKQDYLDAQAVAKALDIKIYKADFIKEYWDNVFEYFIDEYKKSRTPNPDMLCNKYIKFEAFYNYAMKMFGPDYIAMGHYANTQKINEATFLTMAKDLNKDQTYFLALLKENQIKNTLFPIGNLLKDEVRLIAKENNLPIWSKKDSTGICFIGERRFTEFLTNYISNQPGNFVDIETNKIVGKHIGTMYYTIGQNKNLHLSGNKQRYFVCDKDVNKKILYVVCEQNKDKYLQSNQCTISDFNFINELSKNDLTNLKVRFRHRQELTNVVKFYELENNIWQLQYESTLMVTPGQYAVLYQKNICVGGGIIEKAYNKMVR